MRKSLNIFGFACVALALTACKSPDDYKVTVPKVEVPDFKLDDPNVDLSWLMTCNEAESTQDFSKQSADKFVLLEGTIETQQTQFIDCKKQTKDGGVLDLNWLENGVFIGPEQTLTEKAAAIEVENTRTCVKFKVEMSESEEAAKKVVRGSILYPDGTAYIYYSSSEIKIATVLNVGEGKNLINIRYLRADGSVISSQEFAIDAKISRILKEGVRQVDTCTEDKDSNKSDNSKKSE